MKLGFPLFLLTQVKRSVVKDNVQAGELEMYPSKAELQWMQYLGKRGEVDVGHMGGNIH